ncbi:hypothetical protein [Ruminococcus sp.]|uniref:hypothetical protein n=1 Tax=Ruminococcus sp. TaxID=41978 RepID=UPI002E7912CA|nr:hypothetical protein [Ruminococcus sp.]MEE1262599.1 hypothetical protein [Ruminococcus sp.]
MKPEYVRSKLIITEFDKEDVITTSGGGESEDRKMEVENSYVAIKRIRGMPGPWF